MSENELVFMAFGKQRANDRTLVRREYKPSGWA